MSVEVITGIVEPLEGPGPDRRGSTPDTHHPGLPDLQVDGPALRVYSHTLLVELKSHPLALQWPPYLDAAYKNGRGVWDPDRWHLDRKRGETPEPADRLPAPRARPEPARPEVDDDPGQLVLSPQRRSFLSGCAAAAGEAGDVSLRPEAPGKRVGSGRLLAREPEGPGAEGRAGFRRGDEVRRPGGRTEEPTGGRFGFRGGREEERDSGWGAEDRRGRGGAQRGETGFYEAERRGGEGRGGEGRGGEGRGGEGRGGEGRGGGEDRRLERDRDLRGGRDRNGRRRQNEPEWMNECVSKSDVIELRGFDGPGKSGKEKEPALVAAGIARPAGAGKALDLGHLLPGLGRQAGPGLPAGGISAEDLEREQLGRNGSGPDRGRAAPPARPEGSGGPQGGGFNYDQIIEGINLNSLLGGSAPQEVQQAAPAPQGSRFSQFFARGPHPAPEARQRPPAHCGLEEPAPCIRIPSPGEEERYFAPISPAAQTRTLTGGLMDQLSKGPGAHPPRQVQQLEDGIRRQLGIAGPAPPGLPPAYGAHRPAAAQRQARPQEAGGEQDGMSAFKKLVAQMGGQPEAAREQAVPFGPGVVRPAPISASLPQNAPTEQEILEHMMAGGQPPRQPSPLAPKLPALPPALSQYLASCPLNTDLLARPEAEQLILGINSGNITLDNLLHQLSNPGLQPRQRDLLLSVLKLRSLGPDPRRAAPGPPRAPHHAPHLAPRLSPAPQPAGGDPLQLPASRVSPLMFPASGGPAAHLAVSPAPQAARVPSPQEMTVLTQQIMQQALIKRKLEEQKENYRRRQGDEPGPGQVLQAAANSSPLSFTPTSVLRKTAADRKDSDPRLQSLVPEVKVTPQNAGPAPGEARPQCPPSPGRAITKGGEEGRDRPGSLELGPRRAAPGQFPAGPQHGVNPLIYLQNNNMAGHINPAMLTQATAMAHQQIAAASLLAHGLDPRLARLPGHPALGPVSPSRSQPQGFPPAAQGQGSSVNLARFFSPEVLAQAQSGSVPAMPPLPTQKVLTLEEIERQAAAVRT